MRDRQRSLDLPVFASNLAANDLSFEAGDSFWSDVARLTAACTLGEQVDAVMGGVASPRVWLIMHEAGRPELSAAAALSLVRELAHRDQAALVLDADEDTSGLSTWAGRKETEGWIDVARYGTSILTAGVTLPIDGRRGYLLGVGSFIPTDITGEEIATLMARLRWKADDVLVVAPAGTAALEWARHADLRLLCWDRAARSVEELAPMIEPFTAFGSPVMGLVGFGEAVVQAGPLVAEPPADPRVVEPVMAAPIGAAPIDERPVSPLRMPPPVVELPGELEGPRRGSKVSWLVMAGFAVAIAVISGYWLKYVRVPPTGYFAPVADDVGKQPSDGLNVKAADSVAVGSLSTAMGLGDSLASGWVGGRASAEPARSVALQDTGAAPVVETAPAAPVVVAPVSSTPEANAYTVPVGAAGWALHVYSHADSAGAGKQVADLHQAGFQTAIRIVEIKEKGGRWWRIYVGSFPSRAAARAAMPVLMEQLKIDWADPAQIQGSAP